jgi:hypothetical protein
VTGLTRVHWIVKGQPEAEKHHIYLNARRTHLLIDRTMDIGHIQVGGISIEVTIPSGVAVGHTRRDESTFSVLSKLLLPACPPRAPRVVALSISNGQVVKMNTGRGDECRPVGARAL